jgi:hypothetical protein
MSFRLILVVAPSFVRERLLCGTSVTWITGVGLRIIKIDGRAVRDGKHRGKVGDEAN